jgi:MFS family permease
MENYRMILVIAAIASLGAAYAFYKIPSRPIPRQENGSPLSNFKVIGKDKLFLSMLLLVTLTGVANQMTIPLRVEYLANAKYGINVSNSAIALIITTIPHLSQTLSSVIWGKFFDRLPIIRIRIIVNTFLMIGFAIFFNARTFAWLSMAAACIGVGYGGGEVLWRLWVTKIVERNKLSQYMSVDAAFVGARSVASPFVAYSLLECGISLPSIGNISAILVLCSIIGFFFIRKHPRFLETYD